MSAGSPFLHQTKQNKKKGKERQASGEREREMVSFSCLVFFFGRERMCHFAGSGRLRAT